SLGLPASSPVSALNIQAAWWRHPALANLSWLTYALGDGTDRHARINASVCQFLERHGARVDRRFRRLIEDLPARCAAALDAVDGAPVTLVHRDLHLDNVLFHRDDGERPVTILDWQSVSRGPAVIDLAHFLADSLSVKTRRACEANLLREYHRLLVAQSVSDYSLDDLLCDYRRALLRAQASVVGWLGAVEIESLVGRERQLAEMALTEGRVFHASLDHHGFDR
ncbi:MAG: phosphotransferase, partial [Vicinamibacterales bacterium]